MPHDPDEIQRRRVQLQEASARLVRTVDALTPDQYREPSLLPGWSRAHVVAHLALNAEGLVAALTGVVSGEPVPMYASDAARGSDIEALSAAEPAELRERLMAGVTELDDAVAAVPDDAWGADIERTPGSDRRFRAGAVVSMRLREVEIHHADLDAGYGRHDWPPAFSALVLEGMARRGPAERPFTAAPTDLDTVFAYGEGGPTVSGSAADLAWWVTGRGTGDGLTSSDGGLPRIEEW